MLLVLDNCEHIIDAAASCADRILADTAGVKILAAGRREILGPLELARVDIDRDDRGRSGDLGSHDDRVADAATADHSDRVAWLDIGGVERGAHPSGDAAAKQAHLGRRQLGRVGDALVRVDQRVGAERADAEDRQEHGAVHGAHSLLGVQ